MPKLRLITFTLLALSAATAVHAEEKRYVSDELNTWVRTGPGDNYRLQGTINAGEEVSLLQTNDSTGYAQIRDGNGRTAWIPLKELSTEPTRLRRISYAVFCLKKEKHKRAEQMSCLHGAKRRPLACTQLQAHGTKGHQG